ncbi:ligase [Lithospermum erythrorhizon]|uniref:Ligase n=1 Tax=Lithospermum erythrorhizon TaxID=34254 RepID=A0AAV3QWM2_LITER
MKILSPLYKLNYPIDVKILSPLYNPQHRGFCAFPEDPQLNEMMEFLENLKNYEKVGVPKGAGTDSQLGFDLQRMKQLMHILGNPQSNFKSVHIAGTKGKGSTASYLSSILRAAGYSVGCYTSPHIKTIRERMTLGVSGEPVSSQGLNNHFQRIKADIKKALQLENMHLTHFEVLTAMAFSLFAQENVDIAVIEAGLGGARDATNIISSSDLTASVITSIGEEHMDALGGSLESIAEAKSGIIKDGRPLILGGPFHPHIEQILRDKALCMSSPIMSASDHGNKSILKGFNYLHGQPYQSCDILLNIDKDFPLFIELLDVKLQMLGSHQLQNAATAICTALCLCSQGWKISSKSIRAGLESAYLLGRSQILRSAGAKRLGVPDATIMLDGAHTKDSARALADTVNMAFPAAKVILVVAMANDKDHLGFAEELLSVRGLKAVFLSEVNIAGDRSRTVSASLLRESWTEASRKMGIDIHENSNNGGLRESLQSSVVRNRTITLHKEEVMASIRAGNEILNRMVGDGDPFGIIIVTGSLHIVSSVLGYCQDNS